MKKLSNTEVELKKRIAYVTGNFYPKMLLIDASIEGPKNLWRVALQMPGPQ